MADDLQLKFGADASGAVEGGEEAAGAVNNVTATVKGLMDLLLELGGAARGSFREMAVGAHEAGAQIKETAAAVTEFRELVSGVGEALIAAFAIEQISEFAKKMGETAEKALHTAETFGLTVTEVQHLNAEAALAGVSGETLTNAMQRLDKAFATAKAGGTSQAAAFRQMGIDLQGAYTQTELLHTAIEGLSKMEAGPAKVAAAMAVFGRNIRELGPLLNMSKEQIEENEKAIEEYGAVNEVSAQKGVALAEAFNTNKVAGMGLNNVLTDALAPALTTIVQGVNGLVKAFVDSYNQGGLVKVVMEGIADVLKVVETALVATGFAFQAAFEVGQYLVRATIDVLGLLWDSVKGEILPGVTAIGDAWHAISAPVMAVIHAIVTGVEDAAKAVFAFVGAIPVIGPAFQAAGREASVALANIAADAKKAAEAVQNIWTPGKLPDLPKAGKGTTADDPNAKAKDGAVGDTDLQKWEAELQDKKLAEHNFWNEDLAGELAFWESKLAILQAQTGGTKAEMNRRAAEIRQIRQKIFDDEKALANQERTDELTTLTQSVKAQVDAETAKYAAVKDGLAARQQFIQQMSRRGEINPTEELALLEQVNAEMVANERAKADAIYQIELNALHDKERLYANDPVNLKKTQALETTLAAQHEQQLTQIAAKGAADRSRIEQQAATQNEQLWRSRIGPIVQSFGQGLQGMINGTQTFRGAVVGVLTSIESSFFTAIGNMVTNWIAGEIAKTAATQGQGLIRQAATLIESLFGITTSKTSAIAQVGANAAVAGSAGVASAAAIPLIGWSIAPAAGATDFAAAMSFAPAIAAGGYDIPSGINPVVQAHQEEMILPAKLANPLRGLLGNMGKGAGGGQHTYNINMTHAPHVENETPDLMKMLDTQSDDFRRWIKNEVRKDPKFWQPR